VLLAQEDSLTKIKLVIRTLVPLDRANGANGEAGELVLITTVAKRELVAVDRRRNAPDPIPNKEIVTL